jgi:NAD(P)H-dependent flavin oxidoreductase YrpB (nitropropane dioxygenase family)
VHQDVVDLQQLAKLGKPFWLAGGWGSTPDKLRAAKAAGACGVQVGTMFAFTRESGFDNEVKRAVWSSVANGVELHVFTDPLASPTGFPFKVLELPDTLSAEDRYAQRPRACTMGYLRVPVLRTNAATNHSEVVYRCAAEPIEQFQRKGGDAEETVGRKCLCNGLLANIGLGNVMHLEGGLTQLEQPLVTVGTNVLPTHSAA